MKENNSNNLAIASFVLGIVSILIYFFVSKLFLIGLVTGIIGIILSVKSKKHGKSGLASAGFVLSVIATVLCSISLVLLIMSSLAIYSLAIQSF